MNASLQRSCKIACVYYTMTYPNLKEKRKITESKIPISHVAHKGRSFARYVKNKEKTPFTHTINERSLWFYVNNNSWFLVFQIQYSFK